MNVSEKLSTPISDGESEQAPLRLDLGCGPNKKEGYIGLDRISFDGVDHVVDLACCRWPFDDASVADAHTSHFVEHLTSVERVHFCNELYRVLKSGAKCTVIVPHWASSRAYGDPTHQWPPVGEMWFMYLRQEWRDQNAPHTDIKHWPEGFACDFDATWGYGLNPAIGARNAEFQQFAANHYREAIYDLHATLIKR
jgi:hypothetical protein